MAKMSDTEATIWRLTTRVAELQAVIAELRKLDELSSAPDWPGWNALNSVWTIIRSVPSDVLAARDAQVKADALEEAVAAFKQSNMFDFKPAWGSNPQDQELLRFCDHILGFILARGTGTPNGEGGSDVQPMRGATGEA